VNELLAAAEAVFVAGALLAAVGAVGIVRARRWSE
jgi:hypothetical protein